MKDLKINDSQPLKTLIISAFPACGKTYLFEHQEETIYKISDSDSSKFEKHDGWEKEYVDYVASKIGQYDFIMACQYPEVLEELSRRGIPYVIVAPNNDPDLRSEKERQFIKQQWMGRMLLRDNSHIHRDANEWIRHMAETWDEKLSWQFLHKHHPVSCFLLDENQYLGDIIDDLYWKKETYKEYTEIKPQTDGEKDEEDENIM